MSSISKSFATILNRRSCGLNGERQGENSVFSRFTFSLVGMLSATLISSVVRLISSALGGVVGSTDFYLISRNEVRICSHYFSSMAVGSTNRSSISTDVAQRMPCSSSSMSCDWCRSMVELIRLISLLLALDEHSSSSAGASKSISGEIVLSNPDGI